MMLTALRPSSVKSAIASGTPASISTCRRLAASSTIFTMWDSVSGAKKTSAARERIAGLISEASRVVAPIKTKSAGAPSSKSFRIYFGTLGSEGS